jgi:hypothetical protein
MLSPKKETSKQAPPLFRYLLHQVTTNGTKHPPSTSVDQTRQELHHSNYPQTPSSSPVPRPIHPQLFLSSPFPHYTHPLIGPPSRMEKVGVEKFCACKGAGYAAGIPPFAVFFSLFSILFYCILPYPSLPLRHSVRSLGNSAYHHPSSYPYLHSQSMLAGEYEPREGR